MKTKKRKGQPVDTTTKQQLHEQLMDEVRLILDELNQERIKATVIQQSQVDALIQVAKEAGEKTTLYRNCKNNILIATEYEYGLSRATVDKNGSLKSLGAGPVDEKVWTRIKKPAP